MKKKLIIIISLIFFSIHVSAQHEAPQLLKQPTNWEFERFLLPPQFAPDFKFKGAEELRFSPGMFVKDSANYFTYAFVVELDDRSSISKKEIHDYINDYFKGLCSSMAKQRNLSVDTSKITVVVEKEKAAAQNVYYNAVAKIFGVFTDGATVTLNIEVKSMPNKNTSKTYLIFIASPLNKANKMWNELRGIQEKFIMP